MLLQLQQSGVISTASHTAHSFGYSDFRYSSSHPFFADWATPTIFFGFTWHLSHARSTRKLLICTHCTCTADSNLQGACTYSWGSNSWPPQDIISIFAYLSVCFHYYMVYFTHYVSVNHWQADGIALLFVIHTTFDHFVVFLPFLTCLHLLPDANTQAAQFLFASFWCMSNCLPFRHTLKDSPWACWGCPTCNATFLC